MPADTIVMIAAIGAAFAFFAAVLIYGDMTWKPNPETKRNKPTP